MTDRSHGGPGEQGARSTRVTVREAATLQTYPADFQFWSKRGATGSQYQQIGNAFPPLGAQRMLEALWELPPQEPVWAPPFVMLGEAEMERAA